MTPDDEDDTPPGTLFLPGDSVSFTMDGEEIGTGTVDYSFSDDIQVFDLQVGPIKQGESVTLTGKVDMGDLVPVRQLGQGYKVAAVAAKDFKESLARPLDVPPPDWALEAFMKEIQQAASALGPGYSVEVEQHQEERHQAPDFFAILHTPRGSVSQEVTGYDFRDAFRKLGVIE